MRTKTLILAAAFSAVAVASSMAQVFSQNAVGYYNLDLKAGFNLIANQFNNGDNSLNTIMPVVPDGASVLLWNPASAASGGQTFQTPQNFFAGFGWFDPDTQAASVRTAGPGTGFFIEVLEDATVTFVGEVPEGTLNVSILPGFNIVSEPTPQALGLDTLGSADNLPAGDGDEILFFNSQANPQAFRDTINYFAGAGWFDPAQQALVNPTPAVGEAFFYRNNTTSGATINWTRTFDVQ